MASGLQSPMLEKCCFDHIWGPLAGSEAGGVPAGARS